jgi:hypothetical protein
MVYLLYYNIIYKRYIQKKKEKATTPPGPGGFFKLIAATGNSQ